MLLPRQILACSTHACANAMITWQHGHWMSWQCSSSRSKFSKTNALDQWVQKTNWKRHASNGMATLHLPMQPCHAWRPRSTARGRARIRTYVPCIICTCAGVFTVTARDRKSQLLDNVPSTNPTKPFMIEECLQHACISWQSLLEDVDQEFSYNIITKFIVVSLEKNGAWSSRRSHSIACH